jgi:hypothetical protein
LIWKKRKFFSRFLKTKLIFLTELFGFKSLAPQLPVLFPRTPTEKGCSCFGQIGTKPFAWEAGAFRNGDPQASDWEPDGSRNDDHGQKIRLK